MRKLSALGIAASFLTICSCTGHDMYGDYSLAWISGVDPEGESPISLTASDGTGLKMLSLDIKGLVEEPLAFTELHMVFENPEDRQREGRFEITLPPGAAISRFAMKIGDRWQEAEVVERQAARVAYEDFLHRKQDPALLEKKAGNQFRARVFPIPAKAKKELILSYSQELTNEPYIFPLQGLPELNLLNAEVLKVQQRGKVTNSRSFTVKEKNITPKKDLAFIKKEAPADLRQGFIGLRNGDLVLARVAPEVELEAAPMDKMTLLLDTSASRAMGFDRQIERLGKLVRALEKTIGKDFHLRVVCFDQEVEPIFEGQSRKFDKAVRDTIVARHALGASDLGKALTWLGENYDGSSRLILLTDGIVTAGEQGSDELKKRVLALGDKGLKRIDAVIDGGIRDEILLGVLTNAGLSSVGVVVDAASSPEKLAGKLTHSTMSGIKVSVPGADWVWPAQLDGVQTGDEVLIYAGLPEDEPMNVVLEGVGKGPYKINTRKAQRPLLERASANAQIQSATHRISELKDETAKEQFKKQIVDLSIKHRVLSDYTALLVLETEQDYARFNIDRNSLCDIMIVGKNGIDLMRRGDKALVKEEKAPEWVKRKKRAKDRDRIASARVPEPIVSAAEMPEERASERASKRAALAEQLAERGINKILGNLGSGSESEVVDLLQGGDVGAKRDSPLSQASGVRAATHKVNISSGLAGGRGTGEAADLSQLRKRGRGANVRATGIRSERRVKGRLSKSDPTAVDGTGNLSQAKVAKVVNRRLGAIKACYERALRRDSNLGGKIIIRFTIASSGKISAARTTLNELSPNVGNCIVSSFRRFRFPPPMGGSVTFEYPLMLTPEGDGQPRQMPPLLNSNPELDAQNEKLVRGAMHRENPYSDRLKRVMDLLEKDRNSEALKGAILWRVDEPGDVLAIIGLGEAAEAGGKLDLAARVYGSIIDLFPSRADLRRMAGQRLERLGDRAQDLIIDTYHQAVEQRPDHPSSHRLYGYALLEAGRYVEAFEALRKGLEREYPGGRYAEVKRILREDLGLIAAAWLKAMPDDAKEIREAAASASVEIPSTATTRFVLHWETDANDVDLHMYDGKGNHAYYSRRQLQSGGKLYADVTTGYGPECFTINGRPTAFPYAMQTHYYSRGPMGYGMGKVQIIEHDGKGGLWFSNRPFVIMNNDAYVGLGMLKRPLSMSETNEPRKPENLTPAAQKAADKLSSLPIAN
ncbi:MAG: AgmX/PglI C-terminal domain-containing protein [Proteobacteria bacterium]|nr:AgmX/PglI C-terminal domain-containing protein [Pseudomonadota bacterium]